MLFHSSNFANSGIRRGREGAQRLASHVASVVVLPSAAATKNRQPVAALSSRHLLEVSSVTRVGEDKRQGATRVFGQQQLGTRNLLHELWPGGTAVGEGIVCTRSCTTCLVCTYWPCGPSNRTNTGVLCLHLGSKGGRESKRERKTCSTVNMFKSCYRD